MNGRQESFCREFAVCRDAVTAAARAGYRYPERAGARLIEKPEILRRIAELGIADRDEVCAFLTQALRGDGSITERMKAADMLLKCGVNPEHGGCGRVVIFGEEELE